MTIMYSVEQIKTHLEQVQIAGYIYQQQNILALQEPKNDDGSALNIFTQHELSSDQLGLQFGIAVSDHHIEFLIGVTHSNQDRSYEIGAGNLKADQRAFNLLYAFYNYPKAFYLVRMPLMANTQQCEQAIEQQLFAQPTLAFLNTALKTNPLGEQIQWMKTHILQQALDMKVRIQTAL